MMSFKNISSNSELLELKSLYSFLADKEWDELSEIFASLIFDEDIEYAITVSDSCAVVRVFDMGRYLFLFPVPLSERADVAAAVAAVSDYARIQEISLVFSDVPISEFYAFSGFSHFDCDLEDEAEKTYRVSIRSECEIIEQIPETIHPRVTLNALTEDDIPLYARLNRDTSVSKFWGYDYKDDNPDADDEYFFVESWREFSAGTALSLAVRSCGNFIGEAVMFSFDRRGGAEFAVRLLPEFHGKGLGKAAMLALFDAARAIHLKRLSARVIRENLPSCAMAKSNMQVLSITEKEICFGIEL